MGAALQQALASRNEMPPSFSSSLWQPRQRRLRIGATWCRRIAVPRPAPRDRPRPPPAYHFFADAELIARADHFAVVDHDLQQLFALHLVAGFVLQRGDDLLGAASIISPVEE